jgi:hypothetical protein
MGSYLIERSMIPPCPPPTALPLHCMVRCRDTQQGPYANQHQHLLPSRALSALNLQVGLRKPPSQSLRCWSPGQRVWPGLCGAGLRHCHCHYYKNVIMRLKRDPCVTGTQGDCRGGNKTIFSVLKRV